MSDLPLPRADTRPLPRPALRPLLPGLGLAAAIALTAIAVQRLSGIAALSPLMAAMVIGMGLRNSTGIPRTMAPGIGFALKRLLRLAIVLLGFQLTLAQIGEIGLRGAAVVVLSLGATLVFTKAMGRVLGVEPRLAELIAAGSSICGASAVIACNTVTRGRDEDVAYAIACVTVFGSLSMMLFPLLAGPLGLSPQDYGLWAGATIHEVAQVVGAAFSGGEAAGHAGTIAKLSRVILLAPVILSLGMMARRRAGAEPGATVPVPWFVLGFAAVVAANSLIPLPAGLQAPVASLTTFLLAMALAAMGLETDIAKLRREGLRPLLLGALAWIFISLAGLGLVLLL
ncbi:YeiH family protein [Mangrovicoccus algicola]|uniref:YeiH family putative sulfate export transporter n=1 Tax=Mangrovicoccus algicola TaxID=2771008 RepID=A0A8J6YQZ2_9RHOB|nr:YeiH family protein [Mangrovicoccus algicola]MBE3637968.1 YeiH family putative sulfate export transporter [Mangrovicoccus algicola]